ncbi:hypothetical protein SOD10_29210 [Serratia plymuthica]|uniref:Uncharacterized protein n=3 Tax=Enterobacterales TaxID=91347 RepID=S4YQA2_SERPL|nr:hypothetical protein M621_03700 [Serratia plymuthica S13]KYG15870.1 hypothetical protein SOD10_29210 [Serratia plymuthica]
MNITNGRKINYYIIYRQNSCNRSTKLDWKLTQLCSRAKVGKKENIVATTITEITDCFEYFFSSLYRREFVKTLRLNECSERELLPLVRCYLLGWFADNVSPEVKSKLPGTVSGHGYIDFVIDDVAVEFAVRKPTAARSNVSATVNSTEVKKLMKHDGKALLVLFDFSDTPYSEEQIESFRNWPSLGRGNHRKSAFNVVYFFVEKRRPLALGKITKNIRIT